MIDFNWKKLWSLKVEPRVKMFSWKLAWGKLPTSKHFAKYTGMEAESCYVCNEWEDEANHILFGCKYVEEYWRWAERKLGIQFKYKREWKDGGWMKEGEGYEENYARKLINFIAVSLWLIWKNRNKIKHKEKGWSVYGLYARALADVLDFESEEGDRFQKGRMRTEQEMIDETDMEDFRILWMQPRRKEM
ncbi:hypothetical protein Cni_G10252 [Canna indica]|uniref:Reverse transcriptase zinc-binding domain-containing protein n=1 Tax=Canna indica TaxID=4628 RepID=A0AAQ3K5T2_9LILI|nr:hypothetical protein Cni_G10252 [Canna indica]